MKYCDAILVDGKNLLYRSIYAAKSSIEIVHPITIFMRVINKYRKQFNPSSWHIFWDVDKNKIWRKKIYSQYKEGRSSSSVDLMLEMKVLMKILHFSGITQYIRDKNEADDLIYAYVVSHSDDNIVIISSDNDMQQILYKYDNVVLFNPNKNKVIDKPIIDPVVIKALTGDKSDNVDGYYGVAEKTAIKLISENKLADYFIKKGDKIYKRNVILVDLSKNPYIEQNILYINNIPKPEYNIKMVFKLIDQYQIIGLRSEIDNCIVPFKSLQKI